MNKVLYLLGCFQKGIYLKSKWYFDILAIHKIGYESEYIKVTKDGIIVMVDGEEHLLSTDNKKGLLDIKDKITLNAGDLPNVDAKIETSVGLFIANTVKLVYPFGGVIKYKNHQFTDKTIEKELPHLIKDGSIPLPAYRDKYVNATTFISLLSRIVTYSTTVKMMTPPDDMAEFKENLKQSYDTKYGPKWVKDQNKAIEFINELKAHDDEYLKDDPGYKKILSGKITNNSRPRLYASFGVESGFDKLGEDNTFIMNSLEEGYPKNKEELTAMFNSSRSGSYDRGSETQKAGSLAKNTLRPTASIKIVEGDCGTTRGKKTLITEHNYVRYNNSYIIVKGKTLLIEDMSKYVGKTISLRSPAYCLQPGENFCTRCLTENMKDYKSSIPLLATNTTGKLLNAKMKSMHKASKKTIKIKYSDYVRYYDSKSK